MLLGQTHDTAFSPANSVTAHMSPPYSGKEKGKNQTYQFCVIYSYDVPNRFVFQALLLPRFGYYSAGCGPFRSRAWLEKGGHSVDFWPSYSHLSFPTLCSLVWGHETSLCAPAIICNVSALMDFSDTWPQIKTILPVSCFWEQQTAFKKTTVLPRYGGIHVLF